MGFTLKTTGVFLLLLYLLSGATTSAAPAPEDPPAQDSALTDSGEPESASPPALSAADAALDSAIAAYRAAIDDHQAINGPYDMALPEMHFSLGKSLQQRSRFQEAMDAYHRAMYLNRVNDGIYSLSQEPMLRGIIESQLALGQIDTASESYQQLLWLYRKTYGENDPHLIPLMAEISHWHLEVFKRSGLLADMNHLYIAHGLYAFALDIASAHYDERDLRLVPLLENTALTNYYLADNQDAFIRTWDSAIAYERVSGMPELMRNQYLNRNYYQNGRLAYKRMLDILENNPQATALDRAGGYISLGDWLLLFDKGGSAMDAYRHALSLLAADSAGQPLIDELFGAPKMLPQGRDIIVRAADSDLDSAATPSPASASPNSAAQPISVPATREYVMVAVDISAKGTPDNFNTLESYPEKTEGMEKRAWKAINASRFRPRFENGNPVLTKALPVRVLMN
ncbi:energy transducer TonB [Porticoccus sp.]